MRLPETKVKWMYFVIFVVFASLMRLVTSQCSEAHRQTCSWSYKQLELLTSQQTTRFIPDYNETSLRSVCQYYQLYRNCSLPFLSFCNEQTVEELQLYDATFGLVCSKHIEEYIQYRSCYQRLQMSYTTCHHKEEAAVREIDTSNSAFTYVLCSAAREYVLCVYTATALGCSLQAADLYFSLLNQSVRTLFSSRDYLCEVHHPMDVISIYTTTQSTSTSTQRTTTEPARETPKQYISDGSTIRGKVLVTLSAVVVQILTFIMRIT